MFSSEKLKIDLGEDIDNIINTYKKLFEYKELIDYNNWSEINFFKFLPEYFLELYWNNINWKIRLSIQDFSDNFIRKFQKKINWTFLNRYHTLAENIIIEFQHEVNWNYICINQSGNFIKEFKDKVNWNNICILQYLDNQTIEEKKQIIDFKTKHQTDYKLIINTKITMKNICENYYNHNTIKRQHSFDIYNL